MNDVIVHQPDGQTVRCRNLFDAIGEAMSNVVIYIPGVIGGPEAAWIVDADA